MFPVYPHDGAAVVELEDVPCPGDLRRKLFQGRLVHLARANERLILDCSRIRYFGANLLGLLLSVRREVIDEGGELVLCALPRYGDEVLRVTHLDTTWPVYHTSQAALDADPVPLIVE